MLEFEAKDNKEPTAMKEGRIFLETESKYLNLVVEEGKTKC